MPFLFFLQRFRGKQNELILGASPTLYINAKIDNRGEEAHQAVLKVYHPSDMGYEGVELEAVSSCHGYHSGHTTVPVYTLKGGYKAVRRKRLVRRPN